MSTFSISEQLVLATISSGQTTAYSPIFNGAAFQLAVAGAICYELRLAKAATAARRRVSGG